MFELVSDPMGPVVDTTLKELVPAVVIWNKRERQPLTQLFWGVLSRLVMAAQVNIEFFAVTLALVMMETLVMLFISLKVSSILFMTSYITYKML